MPQVPFLGPYGQVFLFALTVFFAYLTYRNKEWKTNADIANSALDVTRTEMTTWKERGERLSKENRELITQLTDLRAKTDLQPLVDAVKAWTIEGRERFDQAMQRLEVIHGENIKLGAQNTAAMGQMTNTLAALSERLTVLSVKQEVLTKDSET